MYTTKNCCGKSAYLDTKHPLHQPLQVVAKMDSRIEWGLIGSSVAGSLTSNKANCTRNKVLAFGAMAISKGLIDAYNSRHNNQLRPPPPEFG